MERRLVYRVREAPDRALAHLEDHLEQAGFHVRPGDTYDLNARRGGERLLVGLAPHRDGLVARVKGKALIPTRAEDLLGIVETVLEERLGPADRSGGGDPG